MEETAQIVSVILFNFVAYLCIGIQLAVLPLYVDSVLGYGSLLAGVVISAQYLATFLSRTPAGRLSDSRGPKLTVLTGMLACAASGACLVLLPACRTGAWLTLAVLFLGRLLLGCGESFGATGATMWGIARVGHRHTARVISWNGVATYTAIALGAPLGIAIERSFGLSGIGWALVAIGLISFPIAAAKPAVRPLPGRPVPVRSVFAKVFPFGLGLTLASIGFGALATFITLYYAARGWDGAGFTLSAFGITFVGIRLLFASLIDRFGGLPVALVSLAVEGAGLLMLWAAASPVRAFVAAVITGIGFSLVFPALGVKAMARVKEENRGVALALYSVFTDFALAATGPLGGLVARGHGFPSVFLTAAIAVLFAWGVLAAVLHKERRARFVDTRHDARPG